MSGASALLASLLFKFSQVIAPGYHLENTMFMVFLAYAYFALARTVFVSAHGSCFTSKTRFDTQVAFGLWFAKRRSQTILIVTIALLAGALLDGFIAPLAGRRGIQVLLYWAAIAFWIAAAPSFLVYVARGASRSSLQAFDASETPLRRREYLSAWLVTILAIALVDALGSRFVYLPLRDIVVDWLPSAKAVYFYSVAYYGCLFAILFWMQSWFVRLAVLPPLERAISTARRQKWKDLTGPQAPSLD
jgi:hypothetical protein